jgi:Na+/proline symporter
MAWGAVMKDVLPEGTIGLLVASFFAAAMSSAATYATTSSAMLVDYAYRKLLQPGKPRAEYLSVARIWAVASIIIAAATTLVLTEVKQYIDLCLSLLCFLGIPIYFGVVWRRANQAGMWLSLALGIAGFLVFWLLPTGDGKLLSVETAVVLRIFISTGLAIIGMLVGTLMGKPENLQQLKRFFVIMNTPIGQEQRLVEAGIRLPTLVDAGLVEDGPEQIRPDVLDRLYDEDSQHKIFGSASDIELRREPGLSWYFPGFIAVSASCIALVVLTWLGTRMLFVW